MGRQHLGLTYHQVTFQRPASKWQTTFECMCLANKTVKQYMNDALDFYDEYVKHGKPPTAPAPRAEGFSFGLALSEDTPLTARINQKDFSLLNIAPPVADEDRENTVAGTLAKSSDEPDYASMLRRAAEKANK